VTRTEELAAIEAAMQDGRGRRIAHHSFEGTPTLAPTVQPRGLWFAARRPSSPSTDPRGEVSDGCGWVRKLPSGP